jgi:glutamate---cysteine ligase / carboxylate-amine ligase
VAARGSRIVNSSSGGGSKDTWILTGCQHDQPAP